MDVLRLLRSKNRCLERFLELTEEFWESAEKDDLSGLAVFESRRDSTLRAIQLFDRKIEEAVALIRAEQRTEELTREIRAQLERREGLVHEIIAADLKIIGKIEKERSRLLKEMNETRKSREVLGKFKSSWVKEAGEELDRKL
jgi:hypothetical protein